MVLCTLAKTERHKDMDYHGFQPRNDALPQCHCEESSTRQSMVLCTLAKTERHKDMDYHGFQPRNDALPQCPCEESSTRQSILQRH